MNDLLKCNECSSNNDDALFKELREELKKFYNDINAKLLVHDGKIAELTNYIYENLSSELKSLLNTMKDNGDFTSIITDVIVNDLTSRIEKSNVYYDGIFTNKLYDELSKCYYYVTRIPIRDENDLPIKLELGIANDNESVNTLESTLDFAHRKNATLCINAGVYDVDTHYPVGTLIKDYKVLYENNPTDDKYQFLAISPTGKIKNFPKDTTASEMLEKGYKDVVTIFSTLISNGIAILQTDKRSEPRQSLGITKDGEIIIVSCDGRTRLSEGMSYDDLARIHSTLGSYNAYILDGGGSVSTVLRGVKQNENIDYFTVDRKVNNFLYIARETNTTPDNNPANELGNVKQELLERLINNLDFEKGYIRIRGPENYFAPGIEMYINNEETRRSKLGLSFDKNNVRNTYLYLSLKAEDREITNLLRIYNQGVWLQTYHGTSGQRPNGVVGLQYFDESLGKPIYYNGTKWVDANGEEV